MLVGGLMAARIFNPTMHGGIIVTGLPTVLIGESGAGSGGGGGGGAGSGDVAIKLATSGSGLEPPMHQANPLKEASKTGTPFCSALRCTAGGVGLT